jgi:hypothetical protein
VGTSSPTPACVRPDRAGGGVTERALGSAWRDQPNQPQQDDRSDEGGYQAPDESAGHDAEHSQEHPSPEQRAHHADNDIAQDPIPMSADHATGQGAGEQADEDDQDKVHGIVLPSLRVPQPTPYRQDFTRDPSGACPRGTQLRPLPARPYRAPVPGAIRAPTPWSDSGVHWTCLPRGCRVDDTGSSRPLASGFGTTPQCTLLHLSVWRSSQMPNEASEGPVGHRVTGRGRGGGAPGRGGHWNQQGARWS